MKNCPFCGTELENSAKFCCCCGRALDGARQAAAAARNMQQEAAYEYVPPEFEQHPFETHPFEPHPYESTDYSSVHVYGADEDPSPQYFTPDYTVNGQESLHGKKSAAGSVLRAIFGGIGTAAALLLCLGAKWSGDTVSAILLLAAAALFLPVTPLDRLRRRLVPKAWLRGLIIAAVIIAAFYLAGISDSGTEGSDQTAPQTTVAETVKQPADDPFGEITGSKNDILKD